MKTQRRYTSRHYDYSHAFSLEFENLEDFSELEKSANGVLKINLSEEFPYPVTVSMALVNRHT